MHAGSLLIAGRSSKHAVSVLIAATLLAGCVQSSGRSSNVTTAQEAPGSVVQQSSPASSSSASSTSGQAVPVLHVVSHAAASPAEAAPPTNVPDLITYPEKLAPPPAPYPYVILPDDPNPRAQSIIEAQRTGTFPERLTPLVAPKPFDKAAWEKDPQAYVNVVEPGRISQMSTDPAAPVIAALDGHQLPRVPLGSSTVMRVQATPYAPVSWVTTSGGVFTESKSGAVTVRADANGIAQVTFYATPGLTGGTSILAASPFCLGRAEQAITFIETSSDAAPATGQK